MPQNTAARDQRRVARFVPTDVFSGPRTRFGRGKFSRFLPVPPDATSDGAAPSSQAQHLGVAGSMRTPYEGSPSGGASRPKTNHSREGWGRNLGSGGRSDGRSGAPRAGCRGPCPAKGRLSVQRSPSEHPQVAVRFERTAVGSMGPAGGQAGGEAGLRGASKDGPTASTAGARLRRRPTGIPRTRPDHPRPARSPQPRSGPAFGTVRVCRAVAISDKASRSSWASQVVRASQAAGPRGTPAVVPCQGLGISREEEAP